MGFTDRNEAWLGERREFRQLNGKKARVWYIEVVENRVITSWGQLGGAIQTATEHYQGVNVGKKNELSPREYALERAREACRKKHWEGYREFYNDLPLDELEEMKIDFDNLPLNLCFYKPDNTMNVTMDKKASSGSVLYSRKRNGLAFVLVKGSDIPHLYSRRMLRKHDDEIDDPVTWDDRFPHIIKEADKVMPPNSILLGELIVDRNGEDDFKAIQSYTKSLSPQSILDQHTYGLASFYIWDVAFWNGVDLLKESPVQFRYTLIHELEFEGKHLIPVEYHRFSSKEEAVQYAKDKKWEGWVVVDPDGVYGEKSYNFKGKPDRPRMFCAKLKPDYEDDFIAIWDPDNGYGERSRKERFEKGIRSVALYQYNKEGEMVYICNLGVGMPEEMRAQLADPSLFPQVWKVSYKDRRYVSKGDDSNALDFASFEEVRTDKAVHECVNLDL